MKLERICYWILIFALGILLLKLQYCSGRKPCPTITRQVIHDTVDSKDSAVTAKPKPVTRKKTTIPITTTSSEVPLTIGADSITWSTNEYSQQYDLENGTVIVESQVEFNELKNQKVFLHTQKIDSTIIIKQTDTLFKEKKQRAILYFGTGLYGNKTSAGAIIKTGFKFKDDKILSFGRMQGFGDNSFWFTQFDLPIKLKK